LLLLLLLLLLPMIVTINHDDAVGEDVCVVDRSASTLFFYTDFCCST